MTARQSIGSYFQLGLLGLVCGDGTESGRDDKNQRSQSFAAHTITTPFLMPYPFVLGQTVETDEPTVVFAVEGFDSLPDPYAYPL